MKYLALAVSLFILVCVFAGLMVIDLYAIKLPEAAKMLPSDIPDIASLSVNMVLDNARQMTSWSLAVFGGASFIVLGRQDSGLRPISGMGLVAVGALTIVSVYSCVMITSLVSAMLAHGFLDLQAEWLIWVGQMQSISLLAAVIISALLSIQPLFVGPSQRRSVDSRKGDKN